MLDQLPDDVRPKVFELIARASEAGIAVLLIGSGPDRVQLCPYEIYERFGERLACWPADPAFKDLDQIARRLHLRCLGKGLFMRWEATG